LPYSEIFIFPFFQAFQPVIGNFSAFQGDSKAIRQEIVSRILFSAKRKIVESEALLFLTV
jgi:hypothetical protein